MKYPCNFVNKEWRIKQLVGSVARVDSRDYLKGNKQRGENEQNDEAGDHLYLILVTLSLTAVSS